jgi:hypothetical protein
MGEKPDIHSVQPIALTQADAALRQNNCWLSFVYGTHVHRRIAEIELNAPADRK